MARRLALGMALVVLAVSAACGGGDDLLTPTSRNTPTLTKPQSTPARPNPTQTASSKPDLPIPFDPLGTKADCYKRVATTGTKYCDDLFLTLEDLDSFWRGQFSSGVTTPSAAGVPYLAPVGVYRYQFKTPPLDCKGTNGLYCTPGLYVPESRAVFLNELALREMHRKGDFSAMIVIAHEWGHHIQNLAGNRFQPGTTSGVFPIQNELQADCYAGTWAKAEDKRRRLDPGDLEQALATAFNFGDEDNNWKDVQAHGLPQQRVAAFRSGYGTYGAKGCADWAKYQGESLVEIGKYRVAIWPGEKSTRVSADSYQLSGALTVATLRALPTLTSTSASSQFESASVTMLGSSAKLLAEVIGLELPDRGVQAASEVTKSTWHARRYERTSGGQMVHGVLYLHVRSGGGAIAIDVQAQGPASGGWLFITSELEHLIWGLSLK